MLTDSVCLVTGGAGTIGSTIVDQLVAAGVPESVKSEKHARAVQSAA